jgi:putative transposase
VGKKAGLNPTDRGKLGTKRSVVTDARGVPVGFAVDGANVPDYKLLEETLDAMLVKPPETIADPSLNLCLDKGYDYDGPRQIACDYNLTAHIRCRGEESKTVPDHPNYKPRRWVVERVHSWINRFRRLLIRWEKKPQNYEAMLQFACGISLGSRPTYWDRLLAFSLPPLSPDLLTAAGRYPFLKLRQIKNL